MSHQQANLVTPDFLAQFNTQKMQQSQPPTNIESVNIQQGLPIAPQDCCPNLFVKRRSSDGQLILNNKPYFFVGTNIFTLTSRELFGDINSIRKLMFGLKASGFNVVRTWYVYCRMLYSEG